MSTAITSPITPATETDLFRYGWRYVKRVGPDGREEFDQVPLTLEDVLHPEEEDFIVHSQPHWFDVYYLYGVCRSRVADDDNALVLADTRIDWGVPGVRAMGPDVAVIFDVATPSGNRGTFSCRTERTSPRMVIEVVSLDHRKNDVVDKVDLYYRAGVPLYVIVDVLKENEEGRMLEIIARRHTPDGWQRLPLNPEGRLWLEPVRIWLGIEGGRARCYDGETGEELLDYVMLDEARRQAVTRADAEAQARQSAEARVLELEARVRELEERLNRRRTNGSPNGPAPDAS